ncbi:unnamed protein product [Effrenium voratum]|uniref:Uncharacterized protein n=1 Tax=Effrenium voratum TaxID=2562239 RepID=A0AA36IQI5_9DINO|nr:unnamed protein product [Effrenium voratum]
MKESLPVEMGPDAIHVLRRQRMERNRLAEPVPQTWSKMTQLWGGGYYQEFEYMPEEYKDKRGLPARQADADKRMKIANHDWRYTAQERRLKHEPMLHGVAADREQYPYLGGDKDAELEATKLFLRSVGTKTSLNKSQEKFLKSQSAWMQDKAQMTSESSFLAGRGKGLDDNSRGSRMTLPIMVQRLQKKVDQDWEGSTVVVSATDQDLIQVAFHMHTVDSERGVVAYMGVLSKDVDLATGLRKVSQLWGMQRDFSDELPERDAEPGENSWMFFLLAPKWVKMRPTDAFYTVHPRSQGSAFRMSTAGSSVLLSLGSSVLESHETPRKKADPSPRAVSSQSSRAYEPTRSQALSDYPKVDLALIEQAVSSLPAIKESRGDARPAES